MTTSYRSIVLMTKNRYFGICLEICCKIYDHLFVDQKVAREHAFSIFFLIICRVQNRHGKMTDYWLSGLAKKDWGAGKRSMNDCG